MLKKYLIIISILLAIPVILSACAVVYICFKLGVMAGVIAIVICLFVIIISVYTVVRRLREKGDRG